MAGERGHVELAVEVLRGPRARRREARVGRIRQRAVDELRLAAVAVLTGGFGADELEEAGAAVVFDSIAELRERVGDTPLG